MNQTTSLPHYRELLSLELARKQEKNSAFSLRAFSKQIQISASHLSRILSGEKKLSEGASLKIAAALEWPEDFKNYFVSLVCYWNTDNEKTKNKIAGQLRGWQNKMLEYRQLDRAEFVVFKQWYYPAILELAAIHGQNLTAKIISERLAVSPLEAELSLHCLKTRGLVRSDVSGAIEPSFQTSGEIVSQTLRGFHKSMLCKAASAIDAQELDKRDFSCMTMAINPEKLDEAKAIIKNFRREMASLLCDDKPQEVYHLAVQLFSLERQAPRL